MITKNKTALFLAALLAVTFTAAGTANAGKPTVGGPCNKCHTAQPDALRGRLGTVSPEFNTMQVKVGKKDAIIFNSNMLHNVSPLITPGDVRLTISGFAVYFEDGRKTPLALFS